MASTCFQQRTASSPSTSLSYSGARPSKPAVLIDVYFSEDYQISDSDDDDDDDDICIYRHL
jgi:hypothetical protein